MTPKHTNPVRTPPRNYTETFRSPSESSTGNTELQDYMTGASSTTTPQQQCLLPTGNSSPAPRFYGLPKIHKTNCPMRPIVQSSLWSPTLQSQTAKILYQKE